uniref:BPTI/Kunitz inhibitor domain-containing protein n=2 Tax=Parascaris univalens TaxID=6257 RepID=A0A915CGH6_PARUN
CVAVLSKAQEEPSKCSLECRLNSDCQQGICCFSGCGTSCVSSAEMPIDEELVIPITAISVTRLEKDGRLGVCPRNIPVDEKCRKECTSDSDCPEFEKCCMTNCGRLCQFPYVATACIHRVAALQTSRAVHLRKHDSVRCNADGTFHEIQCNREERQCWCVDTHSGEELIGTRISSLAVQPDCNAPKVCSIMCHQVKCDYGIRLDRNGCPLNDVCECKNPCEDVKCSLPSEICVLKHVECLSEPCPPIPICRGNPCSRGMYALNDTNGNVVICSRDDNCGEGKCTFIKEEEEIGVCCPSEIFPTQSVSVKKHGQCPPRLRRNNYSKECINECESDTQCEDVEKCCEYDCNRVCLPPQRTTNCIHLRAAISKLKRIDAKVSISRPVCDTQTGSFSPVQCDDSGLCWCVDTVTGNEIYATKAKLPNSAFNVCANKKACAIACDDHSGICPFGLETDSEGCSRTAICRCRNPCDSVTCPDGSICLLRPRECSDRLCIPTPSCERNPCSNEQRPAVETRTFTLFTCVENRTQICPNGFYCTGYDETNQGICCPGREAYISSVASFDEASCTHGDPFSNSADGSPLRCSVGSNACPSTHYCVVKPTETTGICCVTKRYVCNLPMDSGPCMVKMHRYFYNRNSRSCVRFDYGGCSGNLNNFDSEAECERFCLGADLDTTSAHLREAEKGDTYQMGFSLTGPLLRDKHRPDINNVFRDYIEKRFNVDESEITELIIRDDNTVRFSLHSLTAKRKAANISAA